MNASDLAVGDHVAMREIAVDMAAFTQFAALTGDRHPIHYDAGYAIAKGFRGPVAHGLLLLSLSALGATDLSDRLHESMVAMTGVQARFLGPVIAGDVLRFDYTVAAIRPHADGLAKVSFDVTIRRIDPARPKAASGETHATRPEGLFTLEFLLKDHPSPSHASEH
ncbi:MaoC family dehydratase [Bordetella genomosp. 10]|nr:MaoC family dehydratase [Bordetella genomosp. 10]